MSLHNFVVSREPRDVFSRPRIVGDEELVQSGLALSPEEMMSLMVDGKTITPMNLSGVDYDEGYSKLDFDVPLEYQRGVGLGECWEAEMDSKAKLKSAKDKGLFVAQKGVE